MKTFKLFAITGFLTVITVLFSYCNRTPEEPVKHENPNFKQEILPQGKNENYEKNDSLTEGQMDSIALGKKK